MSISHTVCQIHGWTWFYLKFQSINCPDILNMWFILMPTTLISNLLLNFFNISVWLKCLKNKRQSKTVLTIFPQCFSLIFLWLFTLFTDSYLEYSLLTSCSFIDIEYTQLPISAVVECSINLWTWDQRICICILFCQILLIVEYDGAES